MPRWPVLLASFLCACSQQVPARGPGDAELFGGRDRILAEAGPVASTSPPSPVRPRATIVIGRDPAAYAPTDGSEARGAASDAPTSTTVNDTTQNYGSAYPYWYGTYGAYGAHGPYTFGGGAARPDVPRYMSPATSRPRTGPSGPPTTVGGDWPAPPDHGPPMPRTLR